MQQLLGGAARLRVLALCANRTLGIGRSWPWTWVHTGWGLLRRDGTMTNRTEHFKPQRFEGGGIRLLCEVDSARVMINASTRFVAGFEYGLSAEIGISTDILHARGLVGLEGLTLLKWVVLGQGEIRR